MNDQPTRRLFFALWPDSRTRRRLAQSARPLLEMSKGRVIADSRVHLTLAFLGATPEDRLDAVLAAAETVDTEAFALQLNRWSWWRQNRILMIYPTAPPAALGDLVEALREGLADEGLPVERRRFRPHVTLARSCTGVRYRGAVEPVAWPAEEFVLAESEFHSAGARYNILRRWPLAHPASQQGGDNPDEESVLESVGGGGL